MSKTTRDGDTSQEFSLEDYTEDEIQKARAFASMGGNGFGSGDLEYYLKVLYPRRSKAVFGDSQTHELTPEASVPESTLQPDSSFSKEYTVERDAQPASGSKIHCGQTHEANRQDSIQPPEEEENESPPKAPTGRTAAEVVEEAVRAASSHRSGRKLTYECKGYKINYALANCKELTDKVRCTLAIINGLMSNLGFCFGSLEQLSIYMHMSARGAKNLLDKLWKRGLIIHIGYSGDNIKRVVRPDLSNNPTRTQKLIDEYNNDR